MQPKKLHLILGLCLLGYSSFGQAWEMIPQFSILNPTSIRLGGTESTDIADQLTGIPTVAVNLSSNLTSFSHFQLSGLARLGFGFKKGNFLVKQSSGETDISPLSVRCIPLSLATRLEYESPTFTFVKPSFTFGLGAEYLYQGGPSEDLTFHSWAPFYTMGLGLTFLGAGPETEDWFRGFTFGLTYQDAITSPQAFRGWSFDLGAHFSL